MADKMTCPGCDAHLSSVHSAFRDGRARPAHVEACGCWWLASARHYPHGGHGMKTNDLLGPMIIVTGLLVMILAMVAL